VVLVVVVDYLMLSVVDQSKCLFILFFYEKNCAVVLKLCCGFETVLWF